MLLADMPMPKFIHDSQCCKFIATQNFGYDEKKRPCDFYVCGDGLKQARTIIARYGDVDSEYMSGILFGCAQLGKLETFALGCGLDLTPLEEKALLKCLLREKKDKWGMKEYRDFFPDEDKLTLGSTNWFDIFILEGVSI